MIINKVKLFLTEAGEPFPRKLEGLSEIPESFNLLLKGGDSGAVNDLDKIVRRLILLD